MHYALSYILVKTSESGLGQGLGFSGEGCIMIVNQVCEWETHFYKMAFDYKVFIIVSYFSSCINSYVLFPFPFLISIETILI